ncbi:MAG: ATP-grasp domain-containing protein [Planctomycetes bacterium]|nr:ATP-grasp domain-containing protein [Planctomycetota bacterium]
MTPIRAFRRVLVANRGEIAIRVCRALRELESEPVVVYSDVDRAAAHVLQAEHAVCIGEAPARDSYLRIDRLLEAARATGCEAVHPGYGFLSENHEFARAVQAAGLVFLGPDPEPMQLLGSKQRAKEAAIAAGVPVVPGFQQDDGDDQRLLREAERIGFPVMIKASAGGGGRGMRVAGQRGEFLELLAAGRREASAAFGDATMLLEKRVFPARHVEIQIVGDRHGEVVSFGERECSVQRRHQKVLEESPSPVVDAALRERMGAAAVALAKRVGYTGAGTVEFLLDERGHFYFLEVNTRLQVEHPVTEMVTGVDLVHLQVLVAGGAALRELLAGRDLRPRGHAIEARICAESPEQGYLPAAGRLQVVREPRGPGIRVDSGVYPGCEVPVHYDSLLAKLIVHAPDRETACRRLARALGDSAYLGIPTNVDFLRRVVEDPEFRAGRLRTDFLDQRPELARGAAGALPDAVYVGAVLAQALGGTGTRAPLAGAPATNGAGATLWTDLAGFRLFGGRS